ncbi:splicing factor Cactin [Mustelus asterias]
MSSRRSPERRGRRREEKRHRSRSTSRDAGWRRRRSAGSSSRERSPAERRRYRRTRSRSPPAGSRKASRSPDRRPGRSRSPDRRPGRSRSPDRRPGRSRSPDRRPGRSRSPDRRPGRSRSPDRRPGRSRSPDRRPGRSRSPDRRPGRSRSPDRRPGRSRSPDRRPGRSRSPDRRPGRSRSPDRRPGRSRSPDRRPGRSRSPDRRPGRSRSPDRRPGRSRSPDRRPGRSRSPSSTSSSSSSSSAPSSRSGSPGSVSRLLSLQEKLKQKAEKKQQRELAKAMETPEEKRARRLARKEAKERKKREKMGWSEEYMGYTNADNPFGDNNLLGTFKWQKALEKKGISHLAEKDLKDRNKRIQEDNRLELQKVKQLRLEREREKALREQELEMLQREKEAEHFKTWAEQEDYFHLQQAKLRSKIRILGGRAKPIDLLAKYISAEDDDLAVEMHEPYTFLNGLTASDLEDLLEDIRVYMELEQGKNADFWRDMTTITEDEISNLKKLEASGKGPGNGKLNWSINSKLNILAQYNLAQLIDEMDQNELHQNLYMLKQNQGGESEPFFGIQKKEPQIPKDKSGGEDKEAPGTSASGTSEPNEEEENAEPEAEGEAVLTEEDLIQQSLDDYDAGKYSPKLLSPHELPMDTHIVDAEEDLQKLMMARQQLQVTGDASESAEDAFVRKAKEGMGTDEAQFSVEMPLTGKVYLWADKYRPRKPRFFNRVHTGFEWNKYNQTHYDFDNPPPKIVQGYKFNIFYPDLIDKRATPQYFLEPCVDNKDFAILRFHAGPPYEDIAFKIVNREWEYSHRHGFRCQFANGIFQLWFHFKRYRYRR